MTNEVSIERLNEVFNADFEAGKLYRKNGQEVGGLCPVGKNGRAYYRTIVDRKQLYIHRILVAMRDGVWPHSVDHKNGDTTDNRSENLAAVEHGQNMRNRGVFKNANPYGRGIHLATVRNGKYENQYWVVSISCEGEMMKKNFPVKKPNSLLDAQFHALRIYTAKDFPSRHYQSLKDAMVANPEFIEWKKAIGDDFDNII